MTYVVTAKWTAQPGADDAVANGVLKMIAPSRAEPGCLTYRAHRQRDDLRVFFFYEVFEDEDAFNAHLASDHFKRYGLGEIVPKLAEQEVVTYELIDP